MVKLSVIPPSMRQNSCAWDGLQTKVVEIEHFLKDDLLSECVTVVSPWRPLLLDTVQCLADSE